MNKIYIDKDAFVGVHNIDGIECRILFVQPDLKLVGWWFEKQMLVVFASKPEEDDEDEDFEIDKEASGFHQDDEGYWVKPNGDSVVVFCDGKFSRGDWDHVFEKYFPVEYEKHNRLMKEISDKYGYRVGETEEEWVKRTSR